MNIRTINSTKPYTFRTDWQERLQDLFALEDLWLDGIDGKKIPEHVQTAVWSVCERLEAEKYPTPAIFPNTDGGINLQWNLVTNEKINEVIVLELIADLTYDLHRVGIEDRSYSELETLDVELFFTTLRQWVLNAGWVFPVE